MGGELQEGQKQNIIEMVGISKNYPLGCNNIQALKEVNLSIARSEFIGIMGPSASGKSTLLNILGCLDSPTGGQYRLSGRNVPALDAKEKAGIRNEVFGFVFQSFYLLPESDVAANVALPLKYSTVPRYMWDDRIKAALSAVGLDSVRQRYPDQLSGGQQQRVAIARALVNNPDILLADEPTGNLDSTTGEGIMRELQRLREQLGKTVIVITHDPRIVGYADRLVRLEDGRITEDLYLEKASDSVLNSPFKGPNEEAAYEGDL